MGLRAYHSLSCVSDETEKRIDTASKTSEPSRHQRRKEGQIMFWLLCKLIAVLIVIGCFMIHPLLGIIVLLIDIALIWAKRRSDRDEWD